MGFSVLPLSRSRYYGRERQGTENGEFLVLGHFRSNLFVLYEIILRLKLIGGRVVGIEHGTL